MSMIRVLLGISRMTFDEIVAYALAIYEGMKDNPAYPNPPVPMEKFKEAIDNCTAAFAAALDRGRQVIAQRDRAIEILKRMIRNLAGYVVHNCNDHVPTFLSSGFRMVTSVPVRKPPLSNVIRYI